MKYYELELGRQKVGMQNTRQQTEHTKLIQVCSRHQRWNRSQLWVLNRSDLDICVYGSPIRHEQQTMLLHVSYGKQKRLTRVRYGTRELCVMSAVKRQPDQISLCSQHSPFAGSGRLDLYYGLIRITNPSCLLCQQVFRKDTDSSHSNSTDKTY